MTSNSKEIEINQEKEKPPPATQPETPIKPQENRDYDPSWLKGTSAEKAIRTSNSTAPKKDFSDPIFKKISRINGKVNSMSMTELKKALGELQLDIQGEKEVLRKRLKNHYKETTLKDSSMGSSLSCKFDYVCVIDYEATCVGTQQKDYPHEIIEFPIVLVNMKTLKIEDSVSWYCKPVINPKLSKFCTELTGISQDKVDTAEQFPQVLEKVNKWLEDHGLVNGTHKFAVATDGPWDMQNFLNLQCSLSAIEYPRWARKWIDIRKMFSNHLGVKRCGIQKMLAYFNYEFEGQQHCGLDDAKNIARILLRLTNDGCEIKINSRLKKCLSAEANTSENKDETATATKTGAKSTKKAKNDSEPSDADSLEFAEE